ncbi:glycerol-3-phosphate dehydrogenase [Roseibium aestuarii]|uniref:Glycerol-3-phosphate dehydrogenase n=1 Tax=Roseibium aestuarii TaxID=2600299 RepID=A0ABW4JYE0_9HYPH|nr:glycerol-3-phosphate dehydrogenase [Roseibium aestuarii]
MTAEYDLVVIGGGINGTGIARDAAGRGLSTLLVEMGDLAGATSSASTKLIHGGLRYLEYHEFSLVRKALKEREVLWQIAPHIAWPLRFVLPHHKGLRPAWFLRLGLFLYDHLGGRERLPATRRVRLDKGTLAGGLKPGFRFGFEYSDCWVDDARLVVLNARDAADRGARILTRTRCVSAKRDGERWRIVLEDAVTGERREVLARALVNAAGPWVDRMAGEMSSTGAGKGIRLVRGSHIVVPRLFAHDRCFIFQNGDGRIVFAIPYEQDFTLVGTTDVDHGGDLSQVRISQDETDYLCRAVSEYLRRPVRPEDVVHSFSGVRPLVDDGAEDAKAATRDYVLDLETDKGRTPLLSVYGGKITTYRKLAEEAMARLGSAIPVEDCSWTGDVPLPGGDFSVDARGDLGDGLRAAYPFLGEAHAERLVRLYGLDAWRVLGDARAVADLGRDFGATLHAREVHWLMDREWARSAEDILWRRTKLGLRLTVEEAGALQEYVEERLAATRVDAA